MTDAPRPIDTPGTSPASHSETQPPRSPVAVFNTYEDVLAVLKDTENFTVGGDVLDCGQQRPLLPLQVDGAQHRRVRSSLEAVLSPDSVTMLEPRMRASANRLLDRFDAPPIDLNAALARPFPVEVLVDLLDLPRGDVGLLRSFHDRILHTQADSTCVHVEREAVGHEIYAYFDSVVSSRLGQTGNDAIRRLLAGGPGVAALLRDEVVDVCYLLVLAGVDPVSRALAASVTTLALSQEGLASVAGDPAALRRHVEEVLRWGGVVKVLTRATTAEVNLHGHNLAAAERVAVDIQRANRDETWFDNPDHFDSTRMPGRHLAFGAGPHRCVGAHLARWQVRIVIEELHRRFPDLHLDPEAAGAIHADDIDPFAPLPVRFTRQLDGV